MWKTPLLPGSTLSLAGKEIEIDTLLSKQEYLSRRPAQKPELAAISGSIKKPFKIQRPAVDPEKGKPVPKQVEAVKKISAPSFKSPLLADTVIPKVKGRPPQPRHDPTAPGALVFPRPNSVPDGKQIVDVVLDPIISKKLREHQREGVRFLYECVMGMRPSGGMGAILADEMGLGKTLQTIALIWTLLKQNPISEDPPVIKKALIVCPASVVRNWRNEFRKWLGNERIGVFAVDNEKSTRLTDFTMGKAYNVMIIGYEKLRKVQDELRKGSGIDIVIADEGHRLKTAQNKAAQAIKSLETDRIVILSGTPLQNDLSEFFFAVDLVNPGFLGKYGKFKSQVEGPIIRSRQPEAGEDEVRKGEDKLSEMIEITSQFMLRRTADILSKYLPPKTEHILFCRPTASQISVYRSVLGNPAFGAIFNNSEASLQLITALKKVCNSPTLLQKQGRDPDMPNSTLDTLISAIPSNLLKSAATSGKLQVLDKLLYQIRTTTNEKVVLVSHYTSTLDILGNLLTSLSYSFLRLDGSTPAAKRQALVDKFNRADPSAAFAFLLSAKSGGEGLNLIGASRLILFDIDWNPSTDLQVMARIHRDGQKRHCRIYRLLTLGALDEKIYQRQLTKIGLANSIVDKKVSASSFTREELRDLFTLDESGECRTHQLLSCDCQGLGNATALEPASDENLVEQDDDSSDEDLPAEFPLIMKASLVDMESQEERIKQAKRTKAKVLALMHYLHIDTASPLDFDTEALIEDEVLRSVIGGEGNRISFVFAKSSS